MRRARGRPHHDLTGHAFEHWHDEVAWKIRALLWGNLHRTGRHTARVALGRMAVAAARRLEDPPVEGRSLNDQGQAWSAVGDLGQAWQHYEQALDLVRAAGDPAVECQVLANQAAFLFFSGRPDEALRHFARSLAVGRSITGYTDQRAHSLAGPAAAQQALGWNAAARRSWAVALDLYQDRPAHYGGAIDLLTSVGFTPPDAAPAPPDAASSREP
ncbi:hypothetical protein [Kitasatospora sp. NPDC086791]|uniref:hypothetical protein n=1 Tax=Kitasatospora sp. NPDC086791 TaxID=3155178 RepID=UPI00342AB17E